MKHLEGKTAFVTGAASGIGLGIATALAQAGVKVMLCDIEKDALDEAVAGLKATIADVAGVVADVSLKDILQRAADETQHERRAEDPSRRHARSGSGSSMAPVSGTPTPVSTIR